MNAYGTRGRVTAVRHDQVEPDKWGTRHPRPVVVPAILAPIADHWSVLQSESKTGRILSRPARRVLTGHHSRARKVGRYYVENIPPCTVVVGDGVGFVSHNYIVSGIGRHVNPNRRIQCPQFGGIQVFESARPKVARPAH